MRTVADLLARKGHEVRSITVDRTIADAARLMVDQGVGSLVVQRGADVVGIVTRNDLVEALAERPADAGTGRISEIMTAAVQTTQGSAELKDIRERMVAHGIRHMPVLQGTTVIGVITLADVLYLELLAAKVMNEHLESYMYGPYF